MRHALFAIAFSVGAESASAETPSWCRSPDLNTSERTICSNAVLSLLDQKLNTAYQQARRIDGDLDQGRWLASRNECGRDIACLEYTYRDRIAELRAIAQPAGETNRGYDADSDGRETGISPILRRPPADNPMAEYGLRSWLGDSNLPPDEGAADRADGSFDPASAVWLKLDAMIPRPWCDATRLNPTERTICDNRDLSRLDAMLELVYGRAKASDEDRAQLQWLRSERDSCGRDLDCIAMTYADRIKELNEPFEREVERRHDVHVPAGHLPPPGLCQVWYPDRPPGQQPPPTDCGIPVPPGAVLIEG
ncbi:lysozyme inhibitor LprI family protein [Citreimonas salinaria]|uniref:Lysozyme inhibitor LprI N-terminal domain-containing protein n=1 Tax=Citreimonas salinaria TaxID=321339 RepID=A0A1H3KS96_9RHOB|nr:hypothetical protein [Citreimonas salinaria]SDY54535.1 hypothetical protein SAMN05444340_11053 [Citreimonas salinaria]